MNYTLVSGYINIETNEFNPKREQTFQDYKERGQKLINLPIPKIIFIDDKYITQFQSNAHTELIPITLEEMEIFEYYKQVLSGGINIVSPNPIKDTALFHIIQIAKTEFIKKAIATNRFQNDIYAWIDFGISKIFQSDADFLETMLTISTKLNNIQNNTIKLPGCWWLNLADTNSDFARVNWYFCGGFFIGYKDKLLEFEKGVKEELQSILENEKILTFEVNIWFRMWRNGFSGLDWYAGNHNKSMFGF